MYQIKEEKQPQLNFKLPFPGRLEPDNRWAMLSDKIPWDALEQEHANLFYEKNKAGGVTFRMALGTLIIQKKLKLPDKETFGLILENPYMQYLIGLDKFIKKDPFTTSDIAVFKEIISPTLVGRIDKEYPLKKV